MSQLSLSLSLWFFYSISFCLPHQASPYPLILSLENHCCVEQQAVMAQHLRSILGSALLTKPLSDQLLKKLPSPEVPVHSIYKVLESDF